MDITRRIWRFFLFSPIKTTLAKRVENFYIIDTYVNAPELYSGRTPHCLSPQILFLTHCVLTRNPAHFLTTRSF